MEEIQRFQKLHSEIFYVGMSVTKEKLNFMPEISINKPLFESTSDENLRCSEIFVLVLGNVP